MSIHIDFSNVEDAFEPLPTGAYPVQVTAVEVRDGQSGFPYLNWTFEVQDGEFTGRKLWGVTSLSPKALWKLKEFLKAVGEDETTLGREDFDLDPDAYIGKTILAGVTQESYEGKIQNRVDSYQPL